MLTANGFAPARVELTIRRSTRGSRASRSVVIRKATGTEPVSTTSDRIAVGNGLESVITRKLLIPKATAPSDTTVPTTSTAAATMSVTRTADSLAGKPPDRWPDVFRSRRAVRARLVECPRLTP